MAIVENWRCEPTEIARSRGGKAAVVDFADGLVRGVAEPWPPLEILQKLTKSGHESAFEGAELTAVRRTLGFYTDLQSLRSEDAVTWSAFGTVAYAVQETRNAYIREFAGTKISLP